MIAATAVGSRRPPGYRRGPALRTAPLSARSLVLSLLAHAGLAAAVIAGAVVWRSQQPKVYVVNLVPSVAAVGSLTGRARAAPEPPRAAPLAARAETATARPNEPSIPAPPEPARPAPRRVAAARETPALPDAPRLRDIPLPPAARPKLAVPALPARPLPIRPTDDDLGLPNRVAEVRRERLLHPVKLAPAAEPPRRVALRDVPPDRPSRPAALPERPALPDVPARPSPTIPPLPLPRAGQKELPSLSSPEPPPVRAPHQFVTAPVARMSPAAAVPLGRADGSPQGSGAITMNVSDFPFAWYLQAVQRKVSEKWAPPARGAEGRAVIVFEIGRNGEVRRPSIESSSGDALYDQAALRAVSDATPFPPLPNEFTETSLRIHLGFNFTADRG